MGIASWAAAGLGVAIVARLITAGRTGFMRETIASVVISLLAGLFATALDFGGWRIIDGRAIGFAALAASTSIALVRLAALRRTSQVKERTG